MVLTADKSNSSYIQSRIRFIQDGLEMSINEIFSCLKTGKTKLTWQKKRLINCC